MITYSSTPFNNHSKLEKYLTRKIEFEDKKAAAKKFSQQLF